MDTITITYPDNIDIYCFEVTKRDWQGNVTWSEQADTLEEAISIISEHEFHRATPFPKEGDSNEG